MARAVVCLLLLGALAWGSLRHHRHHRLGHNRYLYLQSSTNSSRSFRSLEELSPYLVEEQEAARPSLWPVKREAVVEGDLILGGLMMVHEREDSITCGPVMPQGGIQAVETMLYTLDRVNKDRALPFTIGAHILDDCDKDTYGLEMAVDFIKGSISNIDDGEYHCNKTQIRKVISGVVGAASSVTSIQVANLLRLFKIPQVSFFSTSPELSNKQRFEYFTRTIPSDHYQVKAMVEIVKQLKWSYISIIYEESNYGIKAFEELEDLLAVNNICIAIKEKLVKDSGVAEELAYDMIVKKLLTKSRARGICVWYYPVPDLDSMRPVFLSKAKIESDFKIVIPREENGELVLKLKLDEYTYNTQKWISIVKYYFEPTTGKIYNAMHTIFGGLRFRKNEINLFTFSDPMKEALYSTPRKQHVAFVRKYSMKTALRLYGAVKTDDCLILVRLIPPEDIFHGAMKKFSDEPDTLVLMWEYIYSYRWWDVEILVRKIAYKLDDQIIVTTGTHGEQTTENLGEILELEERLLPRYVWKMIQWKEYCVVFIVDNKRNGKNYNTLCKEDVCKNGGWFWAAGVSCCSVDELKLALPSIVLPSAVDCKPLKYPNLETVH